MIIDCRTGRGFDKDRRRRVFLDGVEIKQVWYVDTELGLVRTYDVLKDGIAHATQELSRLKLPADVFDRRDIDQPSYGVLSETLRGKVVELRPWDAAIADTVTTGERIHG